MEHVHQILLFGNCNSNNSNKVNYEIEITAELIQDISEQ